MTDAQAFEAQRPRLMGLAYRMLGSRHEAEDVVQDAYLRFHAERTAAIDSVPGWLTTVVTRLAVDRLRRMKRERETYVGPWLPEPWVGAGLEAPADVVSELRSDVSFAFLLLLDRLSPEERAAFLLHDVFDWDYAEIARTLEKTEAACRQLVHRAREHVPREDKRFHVPREKRESLLRGFLDAMQRGDKQALLDLLAADVAFVGDGGGKVKAALHPITGREAVASFIVGTTAAYLGRISGQLVTVNGAPGLELRLDGMRVAVMTVEAGEAGIEAIYNVANPEKLGRLDPGPSRQEPRPG